MKGDGGFDGRRGTMGGGRVSATFIHFQSLFNLHNLVLMGNGGKSDTGWGVEKRWKGTRRGVANG